MDTGFKAPGYEALKAHVASNVGVWTTIIYAAIIVLVILIIVALFRRPREGFLGVNPLGNLNTGSNNPLWQMQMGDAGWGGSLHSTYQDGQSRVWGASAEGPDKIAVAPVQSTSCAEGGVSRCCANDMAEGEARALIALDGGGSAKSMSDEALERIMNGGSAQ